MAEPIVIHSRQVEMIPLGALKNYEKNARSHPDAQVASLVAIIRDAGFTNPLLIDDDDVIIAGHGRALAAAKLKMVDVPCVRVSGLTPEQLKGLRLSDNRTALGATWDDALLKLELGDLAAAGFDLSLTGFSGLELTGIFSTQEGNTDPEETPEPPAHPVSQLGDLWRLGDHWLICGDCTDKETVERVLGGQKPHLMVADPPYGVDYNADWRNHAVRANGSPIAGRAVGRVTNDDRLDWREAWALFPGDVAYVWHAGRHASEVQRSLEAAEFEIRVQIVWAKSNIAIGRGHYHWQHEPCWYAVRKGANGHWAGDRKQSTLWQIDKPQKSETGHSTQKPVEAMARPMRNNSKPGDRVYDPFVGSGTTIIAAQMNKRICHAIELSPAYVDVCLKRFADFSGIAPTLAETGETFEQVKASRGEVI
jgi:DNA modification methylase